MIFEVKKDDKTYIVDDLKPFDQQSKKFQEAFNHADKEDVTSAIIASFDNAEATLYTSTNRLLITLKESENEDY